MQLIVAHDVAGEGCEGFRAMGFRCTSDSGFGVWGFGL